MSAGKIEAAVEKIRSEGRVGLMTHIVLGYPSLEESLKLVETMAGCGVDFIEIQIPFSDPTADGPVITQACQAALEARVAFCLEQAGKEAPPEDDSTGDASCARRAAASRLGIFSLVLCWRSRGASRRSPPDAVDAKRNRRDGPRRP